MGHGIGLNEEPKLIEKRGKSYNPRGTYIWAKVSGFIQRTGRLGSVSAQLFVFTLDCSVLYGIMHQCIF